MLIAGINYCRLAEDGGGGGGGGSAEWEAWSTHVVQLLIELSSITDNVNSASYEQPEEIILHFYHDHSMSLFKYTPR